MKWLEARLFHEGAGWQVQLVPEGEQPRRWRPWRDPQAPHELFWSLFHHHEDRDLIHGPWRLRICPRDLEPVCSPLPGQTWAELTHPLDGSYLLNRGWTLSELVALPGPSESSGTVAVLDAAGFAQDLRRELGPCVQAIGAHEAIPQRAILVVPAMHTPETAAPIQQRAKQALVPLIVWLSAFPHTARLVEVVSLGHAKEPAVDWLSRFLPRLLKTGDASDPEVAFAEAGLSGPVEDRGARWLRGAVSSWRVVPDGVRKTGRCTAEPGWHLQLDRWRQEATLTTLVRELVSSTDSLRVRVVLSSGPGGAGLEFFRRRPLLFRAGDPVPPIRTIELGWADDPARQEEMLCRLLQARRREELPTRLVNEASRLHLQHTGRDGQRVLFLLLHQTVALQSSRNVRRQVTLDDLATYLAALKALSIKLTHTEVRLLLHISVQDASYKELMVLSADEDPFFRVDILPAIDQGVPEEELRTWLISVKLTSEDGEIKAMAKLPYEQLIQHLLARFPELPPR